MSMKSDPSAAGAAPRKDVRAALAKWAHGLADINAPITNDDWNVFQVACAICDPDAIRFVIEHGADVNGHSANRVVPRCSPLHILARYDHHEIIASMPGRTNFNKQDQWGFTALHYAVAEGGVQTARALLDRGANVLVRSNRGASAVDIAKALDQTELINILEAKSIIESDPAFVQFKQWLYSLGAGEYVNAFVAAGYDLPFIRKSGLSDADLDCVAIPASKLGLRKKLIALHQLEKFASAASDEEGEESESESEEEDEDSDS
jgi:hypothetical protein